MAVRDHIQRVEKQKVLMVTVDPATRRIEGIGKDGSVIQIATFDVSTNFRWPKEGEYWTVVRENGFWFLRSPFQAEPSRTKIENLTPGDQVIGGGKDSKIIVDADDIRDHNNLQALFLDVAQKVDRYTITWSESLEKWIATPLSIPFVSALPDSALDGDEIYFQNTGMATDGVAWHLRYRLGSASTHKWEFLGGSTWLAQVDTLETRNINSYAVLPTALSLTIPLAGDYEVLLGARIFNSGAGNPTWFSYAIGAAAAIDADGIAEERTSPGYSLSRTKRQNNLAASTTLVTQAKAVAGTGSFADRFLGIRPIRVG